MESKKRLAIGGHFCVDRHNHLVMNNLSRSILFTAITLFFGGTLLSKDKNPPMNVLIIQTDEHNFRTLGCYRELMSPNQSFIWGEGVKVDTPNIDWIARQGAICDSFYATSPVCTPSRAALVSGLYPQNAGAISNNISLNDDVITFAEVLQKKGYSTGYAGKWHLDGPAKPGWAPVRNFGFEDNRFLFNRGHWKKLGQSASGPMVASLNAKGKPDYKLNGADDKSFTTDFLTDRAIDFIQQNKKAPFCYMLAIPDPHGPNTVRAPYDTMFDQLAFQQPPSALAKGRGLPSFSDVIKSRFNAKQMSLYFGMVKCIDDNIGRILDTLRELELIDNTVVIFTSDHGDMCGELGRHNKGIPCEGSARIPFVIRASGIIPPKTVLHEAMGTVDFKPTLLGLLGVSFKEKTEGRDLSKLFRRGQASEDWNDITFVRFKSWFAAFSNQYKLVLSPGDDPAFFNLKTDPNELQNMFQIPRHRETIRQMGVSLKQYAEEADEPHYKHASIRSDLEWITKGEGKYSPPERKKK